MPPTAAFCAGIPGSGSAIAAARLADIIAAIDDCLTDPEISAARLAARLGLSERYVHHLLAGSGLKFRDVVRDKRLELAWRVLQEPASAAPRIAEIAFDAGFADLSNFNRAFRRRYGCTPSACRRRA
jgi:AraC-like DNA-binding protein